MTALFAALFSCHRRFSSSSFTAAESYAADDYREEIETEFNIILDEAKNDDYRSLPPSWKSICGCTRYGRPSICWKTRTAGSWSESGRMPPGGFAEGAFPDRRIDGMLKPTCS